jgi:DNA modification methylase
VTIRVVQGHAPDVLSQMEAESVSCVVTSPPYWSLRRYGTPPQAWPNPDGTPLCADREHVWGDSITKHLRGKAGEHATCGNTVKMVAPRKAEQGQFCQRCGCWRGELGSEPDFRLYLDHLLSVFDEVRRVLRRDGVCWVNLGDSYATHPKGNLNGQGRSGLTSTRSQEQHPAGMDKRDGGLPEKNICMIPFRFAIAMQERGWWLRSVVVWHKLAAMPESVQDRPVSAWEPVFLFSKSMRYFWDGEAVRQPNTGGLPWGQTTEAPMKIEANGAQGRHGKNSIMRSDRSHEEKVWYATNGAALRNVWSLGPSPLSSINGTNHYAAYPPELVRRCIAAGSSERGVCPQCGTPWRRVTERQFVPQQDVRDQAKLIKASNKGLDCSNGWGEAPRGTVNVQTTGWQPSCRCPNAADLTPRPALILDPFAGSGTTLLVADRLGRDAIGIDLQPDYAAMAARRITNDAPLFATVEVERQAEASSKQRDLFSVLDEQMDAEEEAVGG